MQVDAAIRTISEFWEDRPLRWTGGGASHVERLERQFGMSFPDELGAYIRNFAPTHRLEYEAVGNPLVLYGQSGEQSLGLQQPGYNWNPLTQEDIDEWDRGWFLLADEGADPIIVDLSRGDTQILQAMHGAGDWSFSPIADSIGQLLLCAAARHHTLVKWSHQIEDLGDDDLPAEAAAWLFPRMREWAGSYYDNWCGDFPNS
jgi:hypothetical protein